MNDKAVTQKQEGNIFLKVKRGLNILVHMHGLLSI